MKRIANWQAPKFIAERKEFMGSNLSAYYSHYTGDYVIMSYSTEIARATSEGIVWITCGSWSQTTARHLSHVRQGFSHEFRDVVWARTLDHAKTTTKWRDLVGN